MLRLRPQRCDFVKKRDDTVLRLVWGGNIGMNHVGNKDASCRRWFFTLNGHECSTPGTIEAVFSTNDKDDYNLRQTYGRLMTWLLSLCSFSPVIIVAYKMQCVDTLYQNGVVAFVVPTRVTRILVYPLSCGYGRNRR